MFRWGGLLEALRTLSMVSKYLAYGSFPDGHFLPSMGLR